MLLRPVAATAAVLIGLTLTTLLALSCLVVLWRTTLLSLSGPTTPGFYADARYTRSIFYVLKFFFEKNTKRLRALDMSGSVYRSSKRVGLKLRNVNSMSLLRWYLAAAFGFILCYFIINHCSFVPAITTSTVHTLTQSAWQLLQYWKVGSTTLLAATIKLGAQLLFEILGK